MKNAVFWCGRAASWALILGLLIADRSSALVLCKTPDGKTYAGDSPPANCKTEQAFESPTPRPNTSEPTEADANSPEAAKVRAVNLCKKAAQQDGEPLAVHSAGGWNFVVSWGDVECRAGYTGGDQWSVKVTRQSELKAQKAEQAKTGRRMLCLQSAEENYRREWASECAERGFDANCRLPSVSAGVIDNRRTAAKQDCKD